MVNKKLLSKYICTLTVSISESMFGKGKHALAFIFVTLLIDVTGFGIIIPVMPSLIQEITGGTLAQASRGLPAK